ncbi:MAG: metallophosphoesterase [Victivallales bacterium]|nr:metallophosphoesterase [Victivallales bacterium]
MKKLAILCVLVLACVVFAAEPILRVGLITDTHIGKTAESCAHVRVAFEQLKPLKPDLIVHLGDIAHEHYPTGYNHYRAIFNEVFPEQPPKELFIYANHDKFSFKGSLEEAYKQVEKEIGATNSIYAKLVLKGYPFLVFRQSPNPERFEKDISEAETEFPDKPIFVLTHEPPFNTIYNSVAWGSRKTRAILDKHPRVVEFCGHTHSSLRDERVIWQGNFTCINAGCLNGWAGVYVGGAPSKWKKFHGFLLLEVYPEQLVVRRFECDSGKEYAPDHRWTIPLPFDPKTAPYSRANRNAVAPTPQFPEGAAIAHDFQAKGLTLRFPEVQQDTAEYRVEIQKPGADGQWKLLARYDQCSSFYLAEQPKEHEMFIPADYFQSGEKYRISIAPMGFWKKVGNPIFVEVTAPQLSEAEVVYESTDPMKDLPLLAEDGKPVPQKDGFYQLRKTSYLELPKKVWTDFPKQTQFRIVIDAEFKQSEDVSWFMKMHEPSTNHSRSSRPCTAPGEAGTLRYILTFKKLTDDAHYIFQFFNGDPAKLRIANFRIDKLK